MSRFIKHQNQKVESEVHLVSNGWRKSENDAKNQVLDATATLTSNDGIMAVERVDW